MDLTPFVLAAALAWTLAHGLVFVWDACFGEAPLFGQVGGWFTGQFTGKVRP